MKLQMYQTKRKKKKKKMILGNYISFKKYNTQKNL